MGGINIRSFIINELLKLGYNIASRGTIYLVDVIEYLSRQENYLSLTKNLEDNIYKLIAIKYEANLETVKSDIHKASNKASHVYKNWKVTPKTTILYILSILKETKYDN